MERANEEERLLVDGIKKLADWGFGLDRSDIRLIVEDQLKISGKSIPRFSNGTSGKDWMWGFEKRCTGTISRHT